MKLKRGKKNNRHTNNTAEVKKHLFSKPAAQLLKHNINITNLFCENEIFYHLITEKVQQQTKFEFHPNILVFILIFGVFKTKTIIKS